jgi:hypothetical protein
VQTGNVPSIYSDGSRIRIQMTWKTFSVLRVFEWVTFGLGGC